MKNMKKVIAAISAAAMTMSIGVSAFAASAEYDKKNAKVVLKDLAIDAEHQWTVVVISADKQNATLTAEDLYYINQGTNGETFWTNGLGTKVDLADGDHDGTYIVRIGGETITDADDLIELKFEVDTTPAGTIHYYGDVTGEGDVDLDDAMEILYYDNFMDSVFDNEEDEDWIFIAGDVTGEGDVDLDDAMEILYYDNFMDSVFDELESETFVK